MASGVGSRVEVARRVRTAWNCRLNGVGRVAGARNRGACVQGAGKVASARHKRLRGVAEHDTQRAGLVTDIA